MINFTYEELERGPALMTPEEFAILARVTPRTVNNWIRANSLDAVRLSERVYRIPRAAAVKKFFPERVRRTAVRTTGTVPKPGRGEGLPARARRRKRVSA